MENILNERQAVLGRLWQLSAEAQTRWENCRASHRFMAFRNKQLVVYSLLGREPVVLTTLTCTALNAGLSKGLETTWETSAKEVLTVSATPTEVAPSIFLWHTFQTDLQYRPHKGVYGVRFSMLYRCKNHPAYQEEGCFYIQERAAFDLEFPNATL